MSDRKRNLIIDCISVCGCFLVMMLLVAAFTGQWPMRSNLYNSFALQAEAWVNGQLGLIGGRYYDHLELAILESGIYVTFPPFPSYVLLPFAFFMGASTPDGWIALVAAMVSCVFAVLLYEKVRGSRKGLLPWTMFLLLGNGYVFLTVNGWVWFFAQNLCFMLSLMALYFAFSGKGGWALGCWAASVGCRPMMVFYLPVLLVLLLQEAAWRGEKDLLRYTIKHLYWGIGPVVLAASYMLLNYARFGDPLEFGHNYLPEFQRAVNGQFSLSYIPDHLLQLLKVPPFVSSERRLGFWAADAMAFYLINPLLVVGAVLWVYAIVKRRKACGIPLLVLLPVCCVLHFLVVCAHRTLGAQQFGNRYLVDLLPYVFAGLLLHLPEEEEKFSRLFLPYMILGVGLNLVGTVFSYGGLFGNG